MTLILLSRFLIKSHSFLRAKKRNLPVLKLIGLVSLCLNSHCFIIGLSPDSHSFWLQFFIPVIDVNVDWIETEHCMI
jgi:hypothetical protein